MRRVIAPALLAVFVLVGSTADAGFGLFVKFGRFTPYIETRNITSNNNYLIFSAGLAYSFGKLQD